MKEKMGLLITLPLVTLPLVGLLGVVVLLFAGCSATEPSPGRKGGRASLRYQPKLEYAPEEKYPLTVGVLDARDRRDMPFYGGADDYFADPIAAAVSDMLFAEMKTSGLFKEVTRISEPLPEQPGVEDLRAFAAKHRVQMVLATDLTKFNMLREKTGKSVIDTFKISVDVGLVSQLVFLGNGQVVWAEQIDRREIEPAPDGALQPANLGRLTNRTMQAAVGDIKNLIFKTGMSMRAK